MGMDAATVAHWEERFEQLTDAIGPCFKRQDLRRRAIGYLQGLLGRVKRKNSWQLSEYLGRAGRDFDNAPEFLEFPSLRRDFASMRRSFWSMRRSFWSMRRSAASTRRDSRTNGRFVASRIFR
jgi:hypothetical protein